ncbi:hypothetical protein [Amycolatopsis sp. 195334CR]|uniref:hypothetical protein n=1 Tax=Amycolatopsis sp. 195334CR TaxID=2814588 RepID=UPI001A8F554D|nr:hypothetical protein [Amycolatopsis sp. 195334CR]MBN6034198.1 hypothetical protein [Amycolatopsis sp. 195334CR]
MPTAVALNGHPAVLGEDTHVVEVLSPVEQEVLTNLNRTEVLTLIAMTGRGITTPNSPRDRMGPPVAGFVAGSSSRTFLASTASEYTSIGSRRNCVGGTGGPAGPDGRSAELVLDLRNLRTTPGDVEGFGALWGQIEPALLGRILRAKWVHQLTGEEGSVRLEIVRIADRLGVVSASTRLG